MTLIEKLISKARQHYDIELIDGLTLKFKEKKYKTAWVKYVYPNKKQLIVSLFHIAKSNYPISPKFKE